MKDKMKKNSIKKLIRYLIILAVIPVVGAIGIFVFDNSKFMLFATAIAILSCVPFFMSFEKKETNTSRIVLLAVMTALSVGGRVVFSFFPFFKPITAIVIICGMYLGAEAGFMCGALSAFISNFIFTQGPWTAFQMFAWGIIGFIAGLMHKAFKDSKFSLCTFGGISGFLYSFILDINSTLWLSGTFTFEAYLKITASSLPYTLIYAVSNVIFLLLLITPLGKKLDRVLTKFGI